jgi:hypothetical protein
MKSDLLFKPIMEEATLTGFVLQIKRWMKNASKNTLLIS